MNTALWIVQGVLAAMFFMGGVMKSTQPIAKLREKMGWVEDVSERAVRVAGVAEVAGALGLILPMATGVLPVLTVAAAAGLAAIMLLAIPIHLKRRETPSVGVNVALMALALFVAYGRLPL